jgi:hypothetical protein
LVLQERVAARAVRPGKPRGRPVRGQAAPAQGQAVWVALLERRAQQPVVRGRVVQQAVPVQVAQPELPALPVQLARPERGA